MATRHGWYFPHRLQLKNQVILQNFIFRYFFFTWCIADSDLGDGKWHYSLNGEHPFNHPGLLTAVRFAFYGKESQVNKFTISQLAFGAAVVSITEIELTKFY